MRLSMLLLGLICLVLPTCRYPSAPTVPRPLPNANPIVVQVQPDGDVVVIEVNKILTTPIVWQGPPNSDLDIEIHNPSDGPPEKMLPQPVCDSQNDTCTVIVPASPECAVWKYTTKFNNKVKKDPLIIRD